MIKRFDTEIDNINHSGKVIIKVYHEDKVYYNAWFILSPSAKEEINTKFGSTDGPKVINAAQQYIKSLGKEKGSNLLQFINEDPMMVCSLGLEVEGVTMPIRGLRTDGTAYIDSGIKATSDIDTEFGFQDFINGTGNAENILFGARNGSWSSNYGVNNNSLSRNGIYAYYNYDGGTGIAAQTSAVYKLASGVLYINGEQRYSKAYSNFSFNLNIHIFGTNDGGTHRYNANVAGTFAKIRNHQTQAELRDYLPFRLGKAWSADKVSTGVAQAKDTLGMIDLVTGIFYPNAASSGAFTMEGEPTSTP